MSVFKKYSYKHFTRFILSYSNASPHSNWLRLTELFYSPHWSNQFTTRQGLAPTLRTAGVLRLLRPHLLFSSIPSSIFFLHRMKISIITATWNSAATVGDTFESILRQTYTDYEYLVIDGGSTDKTVDLIRQYEPRFGGRMRWISEKDKGIYDAMNKGISMATGDVIGLLNSDDFYTTDDVLQTIAHTFLNHSVDAVYADVHYVPCEDTSRCVRYYSSRPFHRWMMRMGFMPAHPSFYCRKQVYTDFGTFDLSYKVAADFENLLRLLFVHRISTQYIPKDFVTMRRGGASSSGWISHKQIYRDHRRALRTNGVYSNHLLLSLRYLYKIAEVTKSKLFNH